MGEHRVSEVPDEELQREFMKALLEEARVLERMLEEDSLFDHGPRRIGAEQELFLVDSSCRPAPIAMEILESCKDPRCTTELGRFNLEINLSPRVLEGDCLSRMEEECRDLVARLHRAARPHGGEVVLCGILPTLRAADLTLANMTPAPRYYALNRIVRRMRDGNLHLLIKGIDELDFEHDNVLLEAVNTSFQVHFQVRPSEFAALYNLAQVVTAPVLAAAVNSPLLLGKRLWRESRIAVFQHSVDARSPARKARGHRPRVHFGDSWVERSVLEIYREDIARYRVMLAQAIEEDAGAVLESGRAPELRALRLHNGTVYRWNRACYGVQDERAHLRIENRVLPSGPTVLDEISNAAFFFGLMSGLGAEVEDVTARIGFDEAKDNFFAAARHGLKAQLTWFDGEHLPAVELISKRLLPVAERGLESASIPGTDIERYLGTIRARVESGRTGAAWCLRSLAGMEEGGGSLDRRLRALTKSMRLRQRRGRPVHSWEDATLEDAPAWMESYRTIGQFMTTDLFTVRPDDLVDFAASLMEWEHIRHVPVEDDRGALLGLVSHRALLRLVARGTEKEGRPIAVREVMKADPLAVPPDTPTLEAIRLMRDHKVGCLPVVEDGRLLGIVTERDLLNVAAALVEEKLREA